MRLGNTWKADQRRWAAEHSCAHDPRGYVGVLDLNLFQPMSPETKADFNRGSGGELRARTGTRLPKMHALHSSSVLACNIFDYWRGKDLGPLGEALGSGIRFEYLTFEAQFPTGLPGQPPNLDVALWLPSREVWGIESKFTEPFGAAKFGPAFKDKYFPEGQPVWSDRDLIKCGVLAIALQKREVTFRHLDAAQLLKHALGLQMNHPRSFTLVYLYADQEAPEAKQHRREIAEFGAVIDGDFPFVPLSYHTFLKRLRNLSGAEDQPYFEYITKRYGFIATG